MELRGAPDLHRRAIRVRGVVQGVGFRPAMHRFAGALGLAGFVRNDREGVWVEVEGSATAVEQFVDGIVGAAPPASRIDRVEARTAEPLGEHGFRITHSADPSDGADATAACVAPAAIPADLAPCDDCLRELADPCDRRAGYPFINCTACGPRFTIVRDVPYDRPKTTMAAFAMCDACRREYDDPSDRRFHAEPNACPACGPQARLVDGGCTMATGRDAIALAAAAITAGQIVAVKGAGGFALVVDATNEIAVTRLRARKHRPRKPFAVMARSLADAEQLVELDDTSRRALMSAARPIVLAPARARSPLAAAVAPGLADFGILLPPTPLQAALAAAGPRFQVMTSGNFSEEPIARTDDDAFAHLDAIADAFLLHDREIYARADDSVVRASARGTIPLRRARGFVPGAIALPIAGATVLAVGGHERNTVCLCRGGQAVLSQHVGDLDHPDAVRFFGEAIDHLCELLGAEPEVVAHDLHPDYRSTRWALQWVERTGRPSVGVQHHHAHVASLLAEHGRHDRVLAVAFDGTGLGDDGTLWGGEILEADLRSATRLGHLRPIALVGGEAAIRAPARIALAALCDAGAPEQLAPLDTATRRAVRHLLDRGSAPIATGAGRWFDAVGALLGVGVGVGAAHAYDGQAACELEALAACAPDDVPPFAHSIVDRDGAPFEIDLRPMIVEIADALSRPRAADRAHLAARFHATLAAAICTACIRARAAGGPRTVALTGGCFQNRRLLERAAMLLEAADFEVLIHRAVPPNDGGLALGQAAVASARGMQAREAPCV